MKSNAKMSKDEERWKVNIFLLNQNIAVKKNDNIAMKWLNEVDKMNWWERKMKRERWEDENSTSFLWNVNIGVNMKMMKFKEIGE